VLQHVALCCSVGRDNVTVSCSVLHCVVVCCIVLQWVKIRLQCVAAWYSVLQHVAECCSVL